MKEIIYHTNEINSENYKRFSDDELKGFLERNKNFSSYEVNKFSPILLSRNISAKDLKTLYLERIFKLDPEKYGVYLMTLLIGSAVIVINSRTCHNDSGYLYFQVFDGERPKLLLETVDLFLPIKNVIFGRNLEGKMEIIDTKTSERLLLNHNDDILKQQIKKATKLGLYYTRTLNIGNIVLEDNRIFSIYLMKTLDIKSKEIKFIDSYDGILNDLRIYLHEYPEEANEGPGYEPILEVFANELGYIMVHNGDYVDSRKIKYVDKNLVVKDDGRVYWWRTSNNLIKLKLLPLPDDANYSLYDLKNYKIKKNSTPNLLVIKDDNYVFYTSGTGENKEVSIFRMKPGLITCTDYMGDGKFVVTYEDGTIAVGQVNTHFEYSLPGKIHSLRYYNGSSIMMVYHHSETEYRIIMVTNYGISSHFSKKDETYIPIKTNKKSIPEIEDGKLIKTKNKWTIQHDRWAFIPLSDNIKLSDDEIKKYKFDDKVSSHRDNTIFMRNRDKYISMVIYENQVKFNEGVSKYIHRMKHIPGENQEIISYLFIHNDEFQIKNYILEDTRTIKTGSIYKEHKIYLDIKESLYYVDEAKSGIFFYNTKNHTEHEILRFSDEDYELINSIKEKPILSIDTSNIDVVIIRLQSKKFDRIWIINEKTKEAYGSFDYKEDIRFKTCSYVNYQRKIFELTDKDEKFLIFSNKVGNDFRLRILNIDGPIKYIENTGLIVFYINDVIRFLHNDDTKGSLNDIGLTDIDKRFNIHNNERIPNKILEIKSMKEVDGILEVEIR